MPLLSFLACVDGLGLTGQKLEVSVSERARHFVLRPGHN